MRSRSIARFTVAALLLIGLQGCGDDGGEDESSSASGSGTGSASGTDEGDLLAGVETFRIPSANHVSGTVDYPQTPPVGGDHNQVWLNCGAYDEPVPNELAVHSMEHGAVWITYRPDLADADVEALDERAGDDVVVSPWADDDLPSPVVASAWGAQLQVDSADDPAIDAFIDAYRLADTAPEPGAPCSGGAGEPTG